MRPETEFRLNEIWYGQRPVPWWLRALAPAYRAGNRFDRWLGSRRAPSDLESAFIIVVGNITVGGSGKTPVVIRLCQVLREAGFKPGVISRGYGRRDNRLRMVSPSSNPDVVGDEPLLIARRAGVPVIVASNRCEAARTLLRHQVDVIVADDGLQHYRLPRTIGICVIDGSRGFGNGQLVPAGPLREPLDRLASYDDVIVNGEPDALPDDLPVTRMILEAGMLRSMSDGQRWRLAQFSGCTANAIAGIGNPARFFDLLRQSRIKVREHAFPDHHVFTPADFEPMDSSFPILMTEKDAVKCRDLGLKNAWVLSVDAVLPSEWERSLLARVTQGTESRKDRGSV